MNLNQFLAELAQRGIKLWLEGDTLRFRAPKGVMTSEERDLLVLHKAKIISLLCQSNTSANDTKQTLVPVSEKRDIPLSFPQEQLWFLSQLDPNDVSYNELFALRFLGGLNIVALEQSLNKLVARHAALRTNFATVNGQPVQVIAESLILTVPVVDLSNLPASDREIEAQQLATKQAQKPFNLVSDPLIQATVLKLTDTEHIFLLRTHHIVWDGWSLGIMGQELAAFYNDLLLDLPPLPVQYPDFAVWQRQYLTGEVLDSLQTYWKKQLLDAPPLLEMPTDRARGVTQTFRGKHYRFVISKPLSKALIDLSRRQKVTIFMTLLAAFQTLLYRYTGQTDLCVGSPIANRDRLEFKDLIGYFVNTLVLRTCLSGNPSFEDLLSRVRKVTLEAYAHRELPFEKLVEILHPERSLSYTPLFQAMLMLLNELPDIQMEGLKVSPLAVETGITHFDLILFIENTSSGLIGEWEYNTDLFDDATIARMTGHFQILLEAIAANPQQPISELPLLTQPEQHQLLFEWNNTTKEYPQDKCIHQLFEEQVALTPDAVAVVFEGEQLTYGELNRRANKLAHYLHSLGVGQEVLVGICVERSFDTIVGILGILKAGGAYVPIDPAYPPERIAYMLNDSGISVLLTHKKLVASLPEHQTQVICLDSDWKEISKESKLPLITCVTPENLAYVIYTSGSTGKPKGVTVPHQAVNRLVINTNYINFQPTDVVAFASNFSFDAATFEIWGALLNGASLNVITKDIVISPDNFAAQIHSQGITVLFLTTALFNLLARVVPSAFQSIRHLLFGGEAVEPKWVKEVLKKGSPQRLLHVYGPTENTTFTSWYLVDDVPEEATTIPIGRPIANTEIYLLDTQLEPVPIGVPGELYIGGDGLARGYLNRPNLTQEKFIPNPFSNDPNSRLYKTGDLARYLPDGNIEFLGRIDNQVKIRGFRIELGEIETAISQHPSVKQTVVIATENNIGNKQLVAYIVPQAEVLPSISDLRHFLKQQLPDYMIPSALIALDNLPLSPNGKIDYRTLPVPSIQPELELTFVAPRTPIEEILANIWKNVLGIKQIGINDHFFNLGGHSLLATQVISRIGSNLNVEIPLRNLFEFPTIAELAEQIQILLGNEKSVQKTPIFPIERPTEIALSFAQASLWFLDQLNPNSDFYNIPLALRLSGKLNITALENSINEIIRRHEALRTNFTTVVGQPIQVITSTRNLELLVVNLFHLPENQREAEAQRLANVEAQRPFNLEQEPLLRANIVQLGETECVLLLTMHHIISDGWSLGVFVRELTELYKAFSIGQALVLPELPIQYTDFTIWQRQWLQGEVLETQLDYWKQQLKDIPTLLELPTDRPRPTIQTFRGAHQSLAISQKLSLALVAYSKRTGVTLFMLLEAAFQTLLYRYTGQDDIVVGTPVAGRNRQEIEGLIGFFVNTLVLRTNLSGNPTFEQLLNRVREVALQAYTHQDLPFEQLVEALHPTRDLSYTPLFQVMFALDDALVPAVELPQLKVSSYPVEIGTAKFDLTLSMENTADGLVAEWEYNTDLFDETTIARMAGHFHSLLEAIAANPKQTISELPLLTQQERQQLLVEWNNTKKEYPFDKCIHQLFEEQVEQTPDKVAVVFEGEQLTYRELNAKANQLARYLKSLGVRPEVLVGICVERSLEMVVGILGILKAGGAYLPLDPAYPQERLAFMLEDAKVSILLTQKRLLNTLPNHNAVVVCLDDDWKVENEENFSPSPITNRQSPTTLAYVIYTSGSTGKSKGVMVQHSSLVNAYLAWEEAYELRSRATCHLQMASFSFDVFSGDLVRALCSGGNLVLCPRDFLLDPPQLYQLILEQKVDCAEFVPAVLRNLIQYLEQSQQRLDFMQLLICGSDSWYVQEYKQIRELCSSQTRLINSFGITEATIDSSYFESELINLPVEQIVPIGRPFANTQFYILDKHLQLVPIGVTGELYIGGAGLARGYLNRPDLTTEKFIPNPFSNQPSSRLYKTGDLARYLPDGNIEFFGRLDNQVKIRGFRIEIGEIEATLSQHPEVLQVAVIFQEDTLSNKRLVAYVVSNLIPDRVPYPTECQLELDGKTIELHTEDISNGGVALVDVPALDEGRSVRLHLQLPGEEEPRWLSGTVVWSHPAQAGIKFQLAPNEQVLVEQSVAYQLETLNLWKTLQRTLSGSLRDYLKQKLPDYMIPSAFVLMKALPLTANGKINRRALRASDNFHYEHEDKFVAPRNPTEAKLAGIWTQVLGLEKIGINDNFFELGGHSLQAVSLVSKLSVEMNLKVSVKLLFEHPTIEKLAKALPVSLTPERSFLGEQVPSKVEKTLPLSFAKVPEIPTFFRYEQRSLLSLFAVGKIAPVDSATLGYIPLSLLKQTSFTRDEILQKWFDNLPTWNLVMETKWGRIAALILPIFEDELYSDPHKLVQVVVDALEMAGRLGAKTVSLTGLIPSATDYGRAIAKAIEGRNNLPKITTGHATTCASVVLTIKKILQVSQRSLEREKVAFIGLGSIGINSLRLMLKCLPHPESIILCDVYSKQESLQNIQRELSDDLGFRGNLQIATSSSSSELPPEIYDATLIIGATNVPDILDIDRLKPGTLIVDDSGPHCFDPEQAIERFEEHKDILFTEGGALHAPDPIETVIYLPESMKKNMDEDTWSAEFKPTNPLNIMGCVMSSLLSSRFDSIKPTVGLPNLETCVQHYQGLERLGFQAADLHCEGYVLQIESNQPSA